MKLAGRRATFPVSVRRFPGVTRPVSFLISKARIAALECGLINRLEQREGAIFEGNEACRQK